ncbi:hypothetical protein WOLCODRAFT_108724 [Wolfiporia cocos MD-104 SS10]|uniref:N-acetyltransferase domain-containing protein n=1 Tax=Wolfiporia cocos (strain MD-104) TaxID=742152 RepID=A0A2H3J2H8_WOLCO|nr:hypothetical protein WOLCODRAFT_108724 [Wolfiporia cocos MD-104 SS10]
MTTPGTETLKIFTLTCASPDLAKRLPRVLSLSNTVFNADHTSKYASLRLWETRLSAPAARIVYFAPVLTPDHPVAFLFAHPRIHTQPLSNGVSESLHIWLAGVLPEYRRTGALARMVSALCSDGDPTHTGVRFLTVCTTPAVFPDMWTWLKRRGWQHERDLGDGKVLMSLKQEVASNHLAACPPMH